MAKDGSNKKQCISPYAKAPTKGCVLDLLQRVEFPKKAFEDVSQNNLDIRQKFEQKVLEMTRPVSNIIPIKSKRTKGEFEDGFSTNSGSEIDESDTDIEDYEGAEEETSKAGDQVSLGSLYGSAEEEEVDDEPDGAFYELLSDKRKIARPCERSRTSYAIVSEKRSSSPSDIMFVRFYSSRQSRESASWPAFLSRDRVGLSWTRAWFERRVVAAGTI
jgi:hypothetical protein